MDGSLQNVTGFRKIPQLHIKVAKYLEMCDSVTQNKFLEGTDL